MTSFHQFLSFIKTFIIVFVFLHFIWLGNIPCCPSSIPRKSATLISKDWECITKVLDGTWVGMAPVSYKEIQDQHKTGFRVRRKHQPYFRCIQPYFITTPLIQSESIPALPCYRDGSLPIFMVSDIRRGEGSRTEPLLIREHTYRLIIHKAQH